MVKNKFYFKCTGTERKSRLPLGEIWHVYDFQTPKSQQTTFALVGPESDSRRSPERIHKKLASVEVARGIEALHKDRKFPFSGLR